MDARRSPPMSIRLRAVSTLWWQDGCHSRLSLIKQPWSTLLLMADIHRSATSRPALVRRLRTESEKECRSTQLTASLALLRLTVPSPCQRSRDASFLCNPTLGTSGVGRSRAAVATSKCASFRALGLGAWRWKLCVGHPANESGVFALSVPSVSCPSGCVAYSTTFVLRCPTCGHDTPCAHILPTICSRLQVTAVIWSDQSVQVELIFFSDQVAGEGSNPSATAISPLPVIAGSGFLVFAGPGSRSSQGLQPGGGDASAAGVRTDIAGVACRQFGETRESR